MRKAVWLLCILGLLFAKATVTAAGEYRGSLQIKLEAGDLAVTNGAVTLYQVGIKTEEGYRIRESLGTVGSSTSLSSNR